MKAVKLIALAIIAVSFVSCNIFLAPIQGRFNPADPSTALVPATVTLTPTVDGYSQSAFPFRDFSSTLFNVYTASNIGLMRVSLDGIPSIVTKATLILKCNAGSGNNMSICKILKPWNEGTIDTATASAVGFCTDPNKSPTIMISIGVFPADVIWDITPYIKEGLPNGIAIISQGAPSTYSFYSIESATWKPQIIVEGWNYPPQ
jgi:hypothetical protein